MLCITYYHKTILLKLIDYDCLCNRLLLNWILLYESIVKFNNHTKYILNFMFKQPLDIDIIQKNTIILTSFVTKLLRYLH